MLLTLFAAAGLQLRSLAQDGEETGTAAQPAADASGATQSEGAAAPSDAGDKPAATTVFVEPPLELKPYEVLISISFSGDASLDRGLRERVVSAAPVLLRSRLGQMWTMTTRDDAFVSPATPDVLYRLDTADLNATFLPSAFDKVILITVSRRGSAYDVAGREWDRNSRTSGFGVTRETYDRRRVEELVAEVSTEVFRPLAMIRQVEEDVVELGIRAGELLAADDDAQQFHPGDYLLTYMRYLDRQHNVGQIQHVPWTFLQVDTVERARLLCHVVSTFRRSPLVGSRRRVELMGIAARPLNAETELTLVPRVDPLNPLVGLRVDVMDRLPTVEDAVEDRTRLLSDRRGVVVVPADREAPLRHVLVHSGDAVLASVPMIPGLEPQATLELPDDSSRLDIEGQIQILEGELIDVVASRAVIMARARRAAQGGRWDDVDRFKTDLDALPQDVDQLPALKNSRRTLEDLRKTANERADRVAQFRINKLCRDFREVAETRLAASITEDFKNEMAELRSTAR